MHHNLVKQVLTKKEQLGVLRQTLKFSVANKFSAILNIVLTMVPVFLIFSILSHLKSYECFVFIPLLALFFVRVFVLQHDCGHRSFFSSYFANDFCGVILSIITGVAHHGWRTEHDWHHQVTGRLDRRGIDLFNSPMQVSEAFSDPQRAAMVQQKIVFSNIAILGMLALLVERKKVKGFFVFREKFIWPVNNSAQIARNLWLTNVLHLCFHVSLFWSLGFSRWIFIIIPSQILAGIIGSLLFWVQHNFEESYCADGTAWSYVNAALQGSSYLKLPPVLAWFTGNIGIHHVHHLNSKIPLYRLKEARNNVVELLEVKPLSFKQLKSAFTHHFWNGSLSKRQTWLEVFPADGKV